MPYGRFIIGFILILGLSMCSTYDLDNKIRDLEHQNRMLDLQVFILRLDTGRLGREIRFQERLDFISDSMFQEMIKGK